MRKLVPEYGRALEYGAIRVLELKDTPPDDTEEEIMTSDEFVSSTQVNLGLSLTHPSLIITLSIRKLICCRWRFSYANTSSTKASNEELCETRKVRMRLLCRTFRKSQNAVFKDLCQLSRAELRIYVSTSLKPGALAEMYIDRYTYNKRQERRP